MWDRALRPVICREDQNGVVSYPAFIEGIDDLSNGKSNRARFIFFIARVFWFVSIYLNA